MAMPLFLQKLYSQLGPGLVTGAADDDPSGIGTYSQAGAQYGNGVLWTMLFSYPLMTAVQQVSGLIGRVTGRGIAGNIRRYYPRWLLYPIVGLMLLANTINIAADLSAMAEALRLLIGGPRILYTILLAGVCIVVPIRVSYANYARVLKGLTLALFAYVATIFTLHLQWRMVLRGMFFPWQSFEPAQLKILVAILGTTISPYLFFWQASQEVEELRAAPDEQPLKRAPHQAPRQLGRIRVDTYLGMAVSNCIAFFIILTTAATLHAAGKTQIETASQAAEALRPIAGRLAFTLFTAGIVGTGLLAVPVLAGSAAYAISETFSWRSGLDEKPLHAKGFYGSLAGVTLLGLLLNFIDFNPIKALLWSAILNGVAAGPILIVMMLMASNKNVMGRFTLTPLLRIMGWLCALVMIVAAVGMFFTL
jgi:NRAMP (natural resistance-associated macrophage protein)-like metal ion transporter